MNCCSSEAAETSPQKIRRVKYLQEILDTVQSLSDEEWESLKGSNESSRLEFAVLCTDIVQAMSVSIIANVLAKLAGLVGMDLVLKAEEVLKRRFTARPLALKRGQQTSSGGITEFLCDVFESIVNAMIVSMQNVIQSIAAESVCRSRKANRVTPHVLENGNRVLTVRLETDNKPGHRQPPTSENLQQDKSFMEQTTVMFVPDTERAPSPPSENKCCKALRKLFSSKR